MKIRNKSKAEKIEAQMAPMIDVVFQLLIFFMLTLKIVEPEGDFNINMPLGQAAAPNDEQINLPDLKVKLVATADGQLQELRFGSVSLGNDEAAFEKLSDKILRDVLNGRAGDERDEMIKKQEVEIDADYNLHYQYVIRAVSACTGRRRGREIVRYIEKIKFSPPKDPPAGT